MDFTYHREEKKPLDFVLRLLMKANFKVLAQAFS